MALFSRRRPPSGPRILNPTASAYRSKNGYKDRVSLTAAGARVNQREGDELRRLIQPWQSRSFAYYDLLGEIKYAAQFYARGLSKLRLYPAVLNDQGELKETDDPVAVEHLDRIRDPGGGRSGLLASYGRLMFLAGECVLLCTRDEDTPELEQWEMLSTDEVRISGSTITRFKAPSLNAEEYREPSDDDWEPLDANQAIAYRLWQRHPRFSMLADCTMQGVLDLCEELVLLTQAVRARARSRLAGSGILFIDDSVSPAPIDAEAADEDMQEDPFMADLIEAMTAPLSDEGTASAIVPLVVRLPTGALQDGRAISDLVYHLQIVDPTQLYPETGLRRECIDRIAIGLDMPPEILLGLQDSNHWTGWQIDEQTWKAHLQPKAQQLVDDLTAAYYQPALREAGVTDWVKHVIAYDAAEVINHPDRTKDAKELHDRGVLSDDALRDAAGFDDSDAPSPEERQVWLGIKLRDGNIAINGEPSASPAGGSEPGAPPGETPDPVSGESPADVIKEPPAPPDQQEEGIVGGGAAMAARIVGAADLAVLRCREAAGNKIRSYSKNDREVAAQLNGTRAGLVAHKLGQEAVRRVANRTERDLVAGSGPLIEDALRTFGITEPEIVKRVVEAVERYAALTLYKEQPGGMPSAFVNYVQGITAARKR